MMLFGKWPTLPNLHMTKITWGNMISEHQTVKLLLLQPRKTLKKGSFGCDSGFTWWSYRGPPEPSGVSKHSLQLLISTLKCGFKRIRSVWEGDWCLDLSDFIHNFPTVQSWFRHYCTFSSLNRTFRWWFVHGLYVLTFKNNIFLFD